MCRPLWPGGWQTRRTGARSWPSCWRLSDWRLPTLRARCPGCHPHSARPPQRRSITVIGHHTRAAQKSAAALTACMQVQQAHWRAGVSLAQHAQLLQSLEECARLTSASRAGSSAGVAGGDARTPPPPLQPRRCMPTGLLAAGGHDMGWRSLRCGTALPRCLSAWECPQRRGSIEGSVQELGVAS